MYNKDYILYTWNHKRAFLKVEKIVLGKNTVRGYLHDIENCSYIRSYRRRLLVNFIVILVDTILNVQEQRTILFR